MFSEKKKSVLIIMLIFIMSFSSVVLYADCDMMAMIAKKGHYISWIDSRSDDYNFPYDFFDFIRVRSRDSNPKKNNDGYGFIYYPEDGNFYYNPNNPNDPDNQAWYQTDPTSSSNTYYTYGLPEWKVALDDAEEFIMDNNTEASIVLGHAREGSVGEGSHPFRFVYTDPVTLDSLTCTFMHNGTIQDEFKESIMDFLQSLVISGDPWFNIYPSNWLDDPANAVLDDFIDSELYFHYLMYYILEANGDVVQGLYNAINETAFLYDPNEDPFDVHNSLLNIYDNDSANFILSDGNNVYAFRNDDDVDHSLGIHVNNSFIGIRTYGYTGIGAYGNNELDKYELAIFTPFGYSYNLADFVSPARLPYFLKSETWMPTYEFVKGQISQDFDNYTPGTEIPGIWITGDITISSDIEITENTSVGMANHVSIQIDGNLTIKNNAALHLNHASEVIINGTGAKLLLDWGSTITGASAGWSEQLPPGVPVSGFEEWFPGDRIIA